MQTTRDVNSYKNVVEKEGKGMKREFLKNLGLEDEVIDKVMTENGNDLTNLKTTIATLQDDIKIKDGVIETKNTKISELEKVDIEALKTAEYERGKAEGSAEVEKFKFQNALESKLKDFNVKDAKVIQALLDTEKIKYENDEITGLEEQITKVKETHDYLFNDTTPPPTFSKDTTGIKKDGVDTSKMTYSEMCKYLEENPGAQI